MVDTQVFLMTIGDDAKNGIIIDEWKTSCNVDPDVEIDANLKYADAWIGLANSAVIDALDTLTGTSTEDTDANINAGAAVANGKVMYIEFDADPGLVVPRDLGQFRQTVVDRGVSVRTRPSGRGCGFKLGSDPRANVAQGQH